MNEEQLIATLQACYFGDRGAFNKILKEYKKLQEESQQLKDRINKAIEWINAHIDIFEERNITIYDWNALSNPNQLLEILKGE